MLQGYFLVEDRMMTNCEYKCVTTKDKTLLSQSDLVIFRLRDIFVNELPKFKHPDQLWLIGDIESPVNIKMKWSRRSIFYIHQDQAIKILNGKFNWSATYKSSSDFPVPYVQTFRLKEKNNVSYEDLKKKTKTSFWTVSNCFSPHVNIRMQYAKELKNHLKLDIFGKKRCQDNKPLPCGESSLCFHHLLKNTYKFYLAFENSICKEYVTEKLGRALKYGSLPIVLGSSIEDVTKITPPDSFLHVDNFTSPKELAEYVNYLDSNFEVKGF